MWSLHFVFFGLGKIEIVDAVVDHGQGLDIAEGHRLGWSAGRTAPTPWS